MTVEEDDVDNGATFLWNLEEAVNAKVASDDTIAAMKADVRTLTMMRYYVVERVNTNNFSHNFMPRCEMWACKEV